jgi:hypothetical protein
MQRQGGGGNDPTCGCDTQAGWPSAAELPRGGIQGGGTMNFNEFNLALTKNGKTRHLRGTWNKNNNGKNTRRNNNNNGNGRPMTSAPPTLKKLTINGKPYETDMNSGDTFQNGKYVGKYVRPNSGKPYLNSQTPADYTPNFTSMSPNTSKTPIYGNSNMSPPTPSKKKSMKKGGGSMPACDACPFPGTGYCGFYARGGSYRRGGGCGCGARVMTGGSEAASYQRGGSCGCTTGLLQGGGYRATKRNLKYLKKWRKGESIGFTMTSSLKAKGLIPRTSRTMKGKRVVSRKYKH